jgi:catechol 2,3-dioxygenase-like lactoylglutathione lyase family enzyme
LRKEQTTMIEGVQVVSVPVSDQDRARDFYTHTLGFELRTENTFAEGMRWIEVAPKGSTTSLTLVRWFEDMPPGSLQGLVFAVDDVHATSKSFLARAFPSILGLGRCLVGYKRCSAIPIATGL